MDHSRPLFLYFCLFNTVDNKQINKQMSNKILPMTGVKPRTSGIKRDRSTNWATTTFQDTITLPNIVFKSLFTFLIKVMSETKPWSPDRNSIRKND